MLCSNSHFLAYTLRYLGLYVNIAVEEEGDAPFLFEKRRREPAKKAKVSIATLSHALEAPLLNSRGYGACQRAIPMSCSSLLTRLEA